MRKQFTLFGVCLFLAILPGIGNAQDRPFLFVSSAPEKGIQTGIVHFDAGWGNGGLGFSESHAIDGRLGIEWYASQRWTVLATFGFGNENELGSSFSGQTQLLYAFRQPAHNKFLISAGGGIRWEEDEGNVGLAMLATGWHSSSWQFDSNVVLEKADAPGRDPVDLIVSAGWLHDVTPILSLGFEAVGQDLEGFWEEDEAEGGATYFAWPLNTLLPWNVARRNRRRICFPSNIQ